MKTHKTNFLMMILLIPILFIGCQKSELIDDSKTANPESDGSGTLKSTTITYCGTPLVIQLVEYDNPNVSYGTVTIGNDQTQIYITFNASPGCKIFQTNLYVGPESAIPGTNIGNGTGHFNVGLFPYHSNHPAPYVQTYQYVLPLNGFDNCFAVVANAKMIHPDGWVIDAYGKNTMAMSWGFYVNYCKQECPPPPPTSCETAYAYGLSYANCFIGIAGVNSNNWGWTNGPVGPGSYLWPIYAGAGQCDIENAGVNVGNLIVNYTPPTATITYSMYNGFVLNSTHLFVGNQILPVKNGKFTTAPGQFPYKHENLPGVSTDTYTINGLSGNIFIAAHSEACGYYE
jgi:hypothetical protein